MSINILRSSLARLPAASASNAVLSRRTVAAFSTHSSLRQIWADASETDVQSRLDTAHPAADKVLLIDFSATWCPPCKMLSPILESVVNRQGSEADLLVVDVDKEPGLASKYKVRAMPTVLALRRGEEVSRFVGAQGEAQVVQFIKDASSK
ncbi:unnamed protein product [Tilletia controversa]|uniref:Thioredoxin domain-containing protein n=3 Tax=Tilletia TaxID=13289 RepID=A0A8X7T0D5_9BASI|nr:hypothetical protein CF336_g870 [Tilletia laevis]KAE8204684.1 hypothetical protein CF328_g947 [Tilletia controversa]KAE8264921.1 hypothetical protein A4X03_0g615 [Tilletia caries]KAE8208299.1 hypothetical protein CF335_g527 [Tilletia laevis]KAE8254591.1 hypothetical protein A4X06_0g835 [Tilletia controversa]